jgi:hypothetical protein
MIVVTSGVIGIVTIPPREMTIPPAGHSSRRQAK